MREQSTHARLSATAQSLHPALVTSLAWVKKAAALANLGTGSLDPVTAHAIAEACDEVMAAGDQVEITVDPIQGGAGTAANRAFNEIITNRALAHLGGHGDAYKVVLSVDHVNRSQGAGDVFLTATRLACLDQGRWLIAALQAVVGALQEKAAEFDDVVKPARTRLQDAVPIRLGQEFGAYAAALRRDLVRIRAALEGLQEINLGGADVGTGLSVPPGFTQIALERLQETTSLPLRPADDYVDVTQNMDPLAYLSACLRVLALNLIKICNDLRLLASGPRAGLAEISLPPIADGGGLLPVTADPTILELVNQVAFQVIGNDMAVVMAAQAGQLELNAMLPVLARNLLSSMDLLRSGLQALTEQCVRQITADRERCRRAAEQSPGMAVALVPYLGAPLAAELAQEALEQNKSVRQVCMERHVLTPELLGQVLDTWQMTLSRTDPCRSEEQGG